MAPWTGFLLVYLLFCEMVSCTFNGKMFIAELFNDYEPSMPPQENFSELINTNVGIRLLSIHSISEKDQYMDSTLRLHISWKDSYMKWNSSDKGGLDYMILSSERLWVPDVSIYNTYARATSIIKDHDVVVEADGTILFGSYVRFKTSCRIDTARFPFDQQICNIILNPTKNLSSFVLNIDEAFSKTYKFTESNEWYLIDVQVYNELFDEKSFESQQKGNVVVKITLKRRYMFHIFKSVLPPVCLSVMNCFVFCLPAVSGERITMAISVLLSYTLYMSFINDSLPENSDTICIFSVYLSCLLIQSTLIILVSINSISLYQKPKIETTPTFAMRAETNSRKPYGKPRNIPLSTFYDQVAFRTFLGITCISTAVCYIIAVC